jgi:hypothetical protein
MEFIFYDIGDQKRIDDGMLVVEWPTWMSNRGYFDKNGAEVFAEFLIWNKEPGKYEALRWSPDSKVRGMDVIGQYMPFCVENTLENAKNACEQAYLLSPTHARHD